MEQTNNYKKFDLEKWGAAIVLVVVQILVVLILVGIFTANKYNNYNSTPSLQSELCKYNYVEAKIRDSIVKLEVACTREELSRGLMFRESLEENAGMLFVFESSQNLVFWMKNTYIDLDIAFIMGHKINEIQQMEALSQELIRSSHLSNKAIEVNRGFFKRNGIQTGDNILFILPQTGKRQVKN